MLPRGLLKEYSQILSLILLGFDVASIIAAGLFAFYYKFGDLFLPSHYISALLIAALAALVIFPFFHIYESIRAKGFWKYISNLVQAICTVLITLTGLAFLTKTGVDYSRGWFIWWAVFSFVSIILFRCTLLIALRLMRAHGWNERHVVIIGSGELGKKLIGTVQQKLWTGFHIVAIFDDHPKSDVTRIRGIPIQQTPENISAYVAENKNKIDEIWLALPMSAEERMREILHELRHDTITTRLMLDLYGMDLINYSITNLAGLPTLNIRSTPMVGINRVIKALEDRFLAGIILAIN